MDMKDAALTLVETMGAGILRLSFLIYNLQVITALGIIGPIDIGEKCLTERRWHFID
ncbi:hypothetical protein [Lacrimispora sp.]|uniref:hypothetical protein n=1 Tax=Lacrimispora sp. TaxID=2719234 RepID=UPI003995AA76